MTKLEIGSKEWEARQANESTTAFYLRRPDIAFRHADVAARFLTRQYIDLGYRYWQQGRTIQEQRQIRKAMARALKTKKKRCRVHGPAGCVAEVTKADP